MLQLQQQKFMCKLADRPMDLQSNAENFTTVCCRKSSWNVGIAIRAVSQSKWTIGKRPSVSFEGDRGYETSSGRKLPNNSLSFCGSSNVIRWTDNYLSIELPQTTISQICWECLFSGSVATGMNTESEWRRFIWHTFIISYRAATVTNQPEEDSLNLMAHDANYLPPPPHDNTESLSLE